MNSIDSMNHEKSYIVVSVDETSNDDKSLNKENKTILNFISTNNEINKNDKLIPNKIMTELGGAASSKIGMSLPPSRVFTTSFKTGNNLIGFLCTMYDMFFTDFSNSSEEKNDFKESIEELPNFAPLPPLVCVDSPQTTRIDKKQNRHDEEEIYFRTPKRKTYKQDTPTIKKNKSIEYYPIENVPFFKDMYFYLYRKRENNKIRKVRDKIAIDGEIVDINKNCDSSFISISKELYEYYDKEELENHTGDIFKNQLQIKAEHFEIVVNWLFEVKKKYRCNSETFYLTVHLFKEYLARDITLNKSKIQLLGLTCFWIAMKFEENIQIKCLKLVQLVCGDYTANEFIDMELIVLNTLNFAINVPTQYNFLSRYLKASISDRTMIQIASYASERILQDHNFHKYLPSELAAACVYISREVTGKKPWTNLLIYHTNYNEEHIKVIAREIKTVLRKVEKHVNAIYSDYSRELYGKVALLDYK